MRHLGWLARIANAINSVETLYLCPILRSIVERVLRMLLIALKPGQVTSSRTHQARIAHAINSVETKPRRRFRRRHWARIAHAINSVETWRYVSPQVSLPARIAHAINSVETCWRP